MEINNVTVVVSIINLIMFIGVPIVVITFIIKSLKCQKEMKTKIEILDKRISELEIKLKNTLRF